VYQEEEEDGREWMNEPKNNKWKRMKENMKLEHGYIYNY
jgi:hypothetical protein